MSNKIIIVTVYNSENCGSFLQAYAMKTILEKIGFEVAFYKRNTYGTSHSFIFHLLSVIKKIVCLNFEEINFVWKPWFSFKNATKIFKVCKKRSRFYQEADTVLLGSDTIWCFDAPYFREKAYIYLGNVFANKYIISYAASVANTSPESFHEIVKNNGGLDNIARILVRDIHTKKLVQNEINQTVEIVTDPTLLLNKDDYLKLMKSEKVGFKYLLLYYFGEPNEQLRSNIQCYAQKNNLKIVSLLKHRKWCHYNIPADPCNAILYFNYADAVITNTFHGCALSMIFEKAFAVHDEGKIKVSALLSQYDQKKRLFVNSREISDLLSQPCDIMNNGKFDLIRKQSLDLLYDALETDKRN